METRIKEYYGRFGKLFSAPTGFYQYQRGAHNPLVGLFKNLAVRDGDGTGQAFLATTQTQLPGFAPSSQATSAFRVSPGCPGTEIPVHKSWFTKPSQTLSQTLDPVIRE